MQRATAESFAELVDETLLHRKRFSVALSGGSTPKRIYQLIAEHDLPWDRIHWFWGDERNVPRDHDDSNANMVRRVLLDQIQAPEQNIHMVPININDPAAAAASYEQTLRAHFAGDKFPHWDLNLLGLGDDAHTASLFPQTDAVQQQDRWFVENWVEKFDAYRYTLTAPAINSSEQTWFLVTGTAKRAALAQVLAGSGDSNQYPALLIRPNQWFVTSDAWG
jgi:6-phosphogluconolactonase